MRLIKVHAPNNKRRFLVYDTGNIIEVNLEYYTHIEKEEYNYGGVLRENNIRIKNNFTEIDEDISIKIINITDGSSFNIKCSGGTDGGAMSNIKYKTHTKGRFL